MHLHGVTVPPSGLFSSVLRRPDGSSRADTLAVFNDLRISSLTAHCGMGGSRGSCGSSSHVW